MCHRIVIVDETWIYHQQSKLESKLWIRNGERLMKFKEKVIEIQDHGIDCQPKGYRINDQHCANLLARTCQAVIQKRRGKSGCFTRRRARSHRSNCKTDNKDRILTIDLPPNRPDLAFPLPILKKELRDQFFPIKWDEGDRRKSFRRANQRILFQRYFKNQCKNIVNNNNITAQY